MAIYQYFMTLIQNNICCQGFMMRLSPAQHIDFKEKIQS